MKAVKKSTQKETLSKADGCISKQKLISAAHTCLKTRGYALTSVKDIAELAGVNHGLVHYHFGSLENLYAALLHQLAEHNETVYANKENLAGNIPIILEILKDGRVWIEMVAMAYGMPKIAAGLKIHFYEQLKLSQAFFGLKEESSAWLVQAMLSGLVLLYNIDPKIPTVDIFKAVLAIGPSLEPVKG